MLLLIAIVLLFDAALQVLFDGSESGPLVPVLGGHGVGEPVGDELSRAGRVAVRKVRGGVPAFESVCRVFGRERLGPVTLVVDELFEVPRFHRVKGVGTARSHFSFKYLVGTGCPHPC